MDKTPTKYSGLKIGDITQSGDELFIVTTKTWRRIDRGYFLIGRTVTDKMGQYRRPITTTTNRGGSMKKARTIRQTAALWSKGRFFGKNFDGSYKALDLQNVPGSYRICVLWVPSSQLYGTIDQMVSFGEQVIGRAHV